MPDEAKFISLTLARFDEARNAGPIVGVPEDAINLLIGTDVRAAATTAKSQIGFKFVMFGLHATREGAMESHARRLELAPWFAEARDIWSAVLQPYHHFGQANFLDREHPQPLFSVDKAAKPDDQPIVILTSVGWLPEPDMVRVQEFGNGVSAVRISMTAVDGLHSQQTFSFPGGLDWDGLTVTFWRDQAAAMAWAYGAGMHRSEVRKEREAPRGDRTSFTRCRVLTSQGIWHGGDPLAFTG